MITVDGRQPGYSIGMSLEIGRLAAPGCRQRLRGRRRLDAHGQRSLRPGLPSPIDRRMGQRLAAQALAATNTPA
jgi:hypothetical protein